MKNNKLKKQLNQIATNAGIPVGFVGLATSYVFASQKIIEGKNLEAIITSAAGLLIFYLGVKKYVNTKLNSSLHKFDEIDNSPQSDCFIDNNITDNFENKRKH